MASHFLEYGVVSMGWGIGPVGNDTSIGEIIDLLGRRHLDEKYKTLEAWAHQIRRFTRDVATGDAVTTYEPQHQSCHVGIISAVLVPDEWGPPPEWWHDYIHRVEWLYEIPRDTLSEYTRKRIGIPLTLTRLNPKASAELRQHCLR